MYWFLLPLIVTVSVVPPGAESEPLPSAYQPCDGAVPVFNPEGCPASALTVERAGPNDEAPCRYRIREVRAANGQPRLEKLPASPEHPPMIAAVDRQIDGCPVMQMYGDASDVRPLPPKPRHGAKLFQKAE